MNMVWRGGEITAEQVREQFTRTVGRSLKESTIRTLLRRLEAKGYVRHIVAGRTYVYRSVEGPRNLAVSAVRQILDRFCGGSVEELLVGMVDHEVLDRRELRRLAMKIAAAERQRHKKSKE